VLEARAPNLGGGYRLDPHVSVPPQSRVILRFAKAPLEPVVAMGRLEEIFEGERGGSWGKFDGKLDG
jgi:hypothetical protein